MTTTKKAGTRGRAGNRLGGPRAIVMCHRLFPQGQLTLGYKL